MKTKIIIMGIILSVSVIGCGDRQSGRVSESVDNPTKILSKDGEDEMQNQTTAMEPADDFDYEKANQEFAELDIPDSIKDIFLSEGEFLDTQTRTCVKLSDYKAYERQENESYDLEKWRSIIEWDAYVAVDLDQDGKKELFCSFMPEHGLPEGAVFHEHEDGRVFVYRHPSLRIHIGENGDIYGSSGAETGALYRIEFAGERLTETELAHAQTKVPDDQAVRYYIGEQEVERDAYYHYIEPLRAALKWTEFHYHPEMGR